MNHSAITRVAGGVLVGAAAFGCACRLYQFKKPARLPIASTGLIGITVLVNGLQFVFPAVLTACRRDPDALRAGEWWRIVTPLFVQAEGWIQAVVNGVAAVIFCPLGERLFGRSFLALYFVSGLVGEIAGYFWNPHGAGSSVGIAGVIGGLFAFAYLHRKEVRGPAGNFAIAGLMGAIVLSLTPDIHGPPILAGALLGAAMQSKPSAT